MRSLIKIKKIVEKEMGGDCSAHDMDHIQRVYNLAMKIAKYENNVDMEVLKISALFHDIAGPREANDSSGKIDHAVLGAKMAEKILTDLGYSEDKIKHIKDCIITHRFRTQNKPKTIEAKILFDADKLETVGAIGIARAFSWIGKHRAKLIKRVDDLEVYAKENLTDSMLKGRIKDKSKHSVQINYEIKDKYLLENLYTKTAKKIGVDRLKYFEEFLNRLDNEANGKI